ncbi:hypothetical protein [Edaphobacillus lindanitolerans]|uniref:Uncharacterized protein n=1 Tax=Edaphobacillus lindanitolerans TaxID=550447 RepID=A0A1U7PMB0_9BACI|nr:hypothetical protein [Edaphobacillus lindanitolerans]SIT81894.1 hypothetical protein SAMN05428946_1449 [Edaphobacillus lindanitolerans]
MDRQGQIEMNDGKAVQEDLSLHGFFHAAANGQAPSGPAFRSNAKSLQADRLQASFKC